jgi:hypothetical protein
MAGGNRNPQDVSNVLGVLSFTPPYSITPIRPIHPRMPPNIMVNSQKSTH